MNSVWKKIVIQTILRKKGKFVDDTYSDFALAKGMREFRISIVEYIKDFVLITIGIFSAAFGFKGFLLTNQFIDGGATGISLLISALTGTPLFLLLILVNIPFVLLGYKIIGKTFALKTAL
ncbi:MAG: YitT family protein, partial [Gloeobacteraceae cyanobacterium ES-bin-316]|nr:YitT family protein [Ferruginibacter sp.]